MELARVHSSYSHAVHNANPDECDHDKLRLEYLMAQVTNNYVLSDGTKL